MTDQNVYSIIAYSIAIFFVAIGILTILSVFFPTMLNRFGFQVDGKVKTILFTKLIIEVIAISFLIYKNGYPMPSSEINIPGQMNKKVYTLFNNASEQFALGNYPAAISKITDAIKEDPNNYILYMNRSVMYLAQSKTELAEIDAEKSKTIYMNLNPQQKRRERVYMMQILNHSINIMNSTGQSDQAISEFVTAKSDISDYADSVVRIFNNIGVSYTNKQDWYEASEIHQRVYYLAKSLDNIEMQVLAAINVSNDNYWREGKGTVSLQFANDALRLLENIQIEKAAKMEMFAAAKNCLGLAMEKSLQEKSAVFSRTDIVRIYTEGIDSIEGLNERSEGADITLSHLYGNRANVGLALGNISNARSDYMHACNRLINRQSFDGISRQLNGFVRILKKESNLRWKEIFALAYLAVKIEKDKPAIQKEEDQRILTEASDHLSSDEKAEIKGNLFKYLQSATGIFEDVWKQYKYTA